MPNYQAKLYSSNPPAVPDGSPRLIDADSHRRGYLDGQADMLLWLRGDVPPDAAWMVLVAEQEHRAALWCLAHNLAVAGGLCAAHYAAWEYGFVAGHGYAVRNHADEPVRGNMWHPNVDGRPAPGWEGEA